MINFRKKPSETIKIIPDLQHCADPGPNLDSNIFLRAGSGIRIVGSILNRFYLLL